MCQKDWIEKDREIEQQSSGQEALCMYVHIISCQFIFVWNTYSYVNMRTCRQAYRRTDNWQTYRHKFRYTGLPWPGMIHIHANIHTCLHLYVCTCVRTFIHTYTYAYRNTDGHTRTHTYIHSLTHILRRANIRYEHIQIISYTRAYTHTRKEILGK